MVSFYETKKDTTERVRVCVCLFVCLCAGYVFLSVSETEQCLQVS